MFSKSNPLIPPAGAMPSQGGFGKSVLASDLVISGDVLSTSRVEILGRVEGNITAQTVIVRGDGQVSGRVRAENVELQGRFGGTIAAHSLVLRSTCDVEVDVVCSTLSIESGALVQGQFKVATL